MRRDGDRDGEDVRSGIRCCIFAFCSVRLCRFICTSVWCRKANGVGEWKRRCSRRAQWGERMQTDGNGSGNGRKYCSGRKAPHDTRSKLIRSIEGEGMEVK